MVYQVVHVRNFDTSTLALQCFKDNFSFTTINMFTTDTQRIFPLFKQFCKYPAAGSHEID